MKDLLIAITFIASLIFAITSIFFASSASVADQDDSKVMHHKLVAGNKAKYI